MIACHADHIGSLLRPSELVSAREDAASGRISPARFKAIEDRAVEDAIKLQESVGLAVNEESYLLDCWERVICPYCRKPFLETARVGSGQKKKGGFCSLNCYVKYYELDIRERLRRFVDPN